MDWDRPSKTLWMSHDADAPEIGHFQKDAAAVSWKHAIEALADVFNRLDDPIPPSTVPFMLWNDGRVSSHEDLTAMRPAFDQEAASRGGAVGRLDLTEI